MKNFFNTTNSQKLLVGLLALVVVAGMSSPALAQEARISPFVENGFPPADFPVVCPNDCFELALAQVQEIDGICDTPTSGFWDSICQEELDYYMADCLEISDQALCPVGGTSVPVSTTSLLVAGAQANMGLWSLALVGTVATGAAVIYKKKSNKTEQ